MKCFSFNAASLITVITLTQLANPAMSQHVTKGAILGPPPIRRHHHSRNEHRSEPTTGQIIHSVFDTAMTALGTSQDANRENPAASGVAVIEDPIPVSEDVIAGMAPHRREAVSGESSSLRRTVQHERQLGHRGESLHDVVGSESVRLQGNERDVLQVPDLYKSLSGHDTRYIWNRTRFHLLVCGEYKGNRDSDWFFKIHIGPYVLLEPGQWVEMPTNLGRHPDQTDGLSDADRTYRLQGLCVCSMSPTSKEFHRLTPKPQNFEDWKRMMFVPDPREYQPVDTLSPCSDQSLLRSVFPVAGGQAVAGLLNYEVAFPSGAPWLGKSFQISTTIGAPIRYNYRSKDMLILPMSKSLDNFANAGLPSVVFDVFFLEAWPTSQTSSGKWVTHLHYVPQHLQPDLQRWTEQWWEILRQNTGQP